MDARILCGSVVLGASGHSGIGVPMTDRPAPSDDDCRAEPKHVGSGQGHDLAQAIYATCYSPYNDDGEPFGFDICRATSLCDEALRADHGAVPGTTLDHVLAGDHGAVASWEPDCPHCKNNAKVDLFWCCERCGYHWAP